MGCGGCIDCIQSNSGYYVSQEEKQRKCLSAIETVECIKAEAD